MTNKTIIIFDVDGTLTMPRLVQNICIYRQ